MSEFKGTKGKWTKYRSSMINIEDPVVHSVYMGTQRIALCYSLFEQDKSKNVSQQEANANAKLISCAPEMFEMLVKIYDKLECGSLTYDIDQLIKKATSCQ